MRLSASRAYLLAGLILGAAYLALHGSTVIYEVSGLGAAAAIVAGVRMHRPADPRPWLVLALAEAVNGVADIVYFSGYAHGAPFPSAADGLYLTADVLFAAALVLLVRKAISTRDVFSYVDAAVFTLALGLLAWAAFFSGAFGDGAGDLLGRIVSTAYPIFDLAILVALVRVVLVRGRRTYSYVALTASVLLLVLSDAWYVVPALTSHYVAGSWRDLGWLLGYTLAGSAALDRSMVTFVRPAPSAIAIRRVVMLGVSLVFVAVAAIVQDALLGRADIYVFGVIGGLMAIFVTVRLAGLVLALEQTRREAEDSERRFRMIFERAPIGISMGRNGIMQETNPALQEMLGYSQSELSSMHYTSVTHPDDRDLSVQQELDASERQNFSVDKRYVRKDGRPIDTHVHVALDLEDGLGISIIEDVTARRELEDQLRQAQKMEAIGKLAGGIAHDFNNLMTAVIGYSDLLLLAFDVDDDRRAKVTAIRESAVRASDLTAQLLAFGRRQVLQAAEVDLRDVVTRMDSLLRRLIGEDIRLETLFGSEPVIVRADVTRLEQVVVNLVVNARDAMPAGGRLVVAVVSDGEDAILSVVDDGTGMPDDVKIRIFEPFFTTKAVGEGSGLGLSTVHGIVGQSGGSIHVDSAPEEGTAFTVRLPLSAAALPVEPTAATLVD